MVSGFGRKTGISFQSRVYSLRDFWLLIGTDGKMLIETDRLILREYTPDDFDGDRLVEL